MRVDQKALKKGSQANSHFALLGSARANAAHEMLLKLTPDLRPANLSPPAQVSSATYTTIQTLVSHKRRLKTTLLNLTHSTISVQLQFSTAEKSCE
jgi:hypothetical protein